MRRRNTSEWIPLLERGQASSGTVVRFYDGRCHLLTFPLIHILKMAVINSHLSGQRNNINKKRSKKMDHALQIEPCNNTSCLLDRFLSNTFTKVVT